MALQIQRLNMDNSWWLRWNDDALLLDPWLVDSEVDGFIWFNEQWHVTPPVPVDAVPAYEHVLVSQPYSDHCHARTLSMLSDRAAFYAVPPARKRINKELPSLRITDIPAFDTGTTTLGSLRVCRFTPPHRIDPIYHALLLCHGSEAVFYAPHGFALSTAQIEMLGGIQIKLLITSFAYFKLPAVLGGIINPGTEAALKLMEQLQPQHVLNTHDENKRARGLVIRLAKRIYPYMPSLAKKYNNITALTDYSVLTF